MTLIPFYMKFLMASLSVLSGFVVALFISAMVFGFQDQMPLIEIFYTILSSWNICMFSIFGISFLVFAFMTLFLQVMIIYREL